MVYDALVWSSLHGLVVGDRSSERSGRVPGAGMVHAPFSLLPVWLPESIWKEACELAPIFNELVDRVNLDGKFLQESLSRTKKVDAFTSRLLDIHSKLLETNKKEEIRLSLHRSDYMLDEQTKSLLQIEMNTISSSFPGLSCLVSELHRNLLTTGNTLDWIPKGSPAIMQSVSLRRHWLKLGLNTITRGLWLCVSSKQKNATCDQHWLSLVLKKRHNITTIRKTLAEIDADGKLQPDRTLNVDGLPVSVVYFRAGYTPSDYPSESRLLQLIIRSRTAQQNHQIELPFLPVLAQTLPLPNLLEKMTNLIALMLPIVDVLSFGLAQTPSRCEPVGGYAASNSVEPS